MSTGNRNAQIAAGIFVGLVSAGLLLLHFLAENHAPSDLELYIGGLGMFASLWLIAPVGMQNFWGDVADALPFLDREEA